MSATVVFAALAGLCVGVAVTIIVVAGVFWVAKQVDPDFGPDGRP